MKFRNIKIGVQLIIAFMAMLSFVTGLGVLSYLQTEKIHQQTEILYNHPLKVRRAIGSLNSNILSMRLGTRDLMLATTEDQRSDAIRSIEVAATIAEREFNEIRVHYLGPQSDVDDAYNAFLNWNITRKENLSLSLAGQLEKVKANIHSTGNVGKLRDIMLRKIELIDTYALNKGKSIYENSEQLKSELNNQLISIVVIFLLLSVIISYYLIRNIRTPINELTDVATRFRNGDLNVRSVVFSGNEFGVLSESFNVLADSIQDNLDLTDMETTLATAMLKEQDPHEFFQTLLPLLSSHTNSQMVAVYLLSDDKKQYNHFESIGLDCIAKESFAVNSFEGEFGAVLLTRKIHTVKRIPKDTRFVFNTISGKFIPREIITIPIVSGKDIIAIISLASVRKYAEQSNLLINRIYDTLTARVEGVLAYRTLKKYSEALAIQKEEVAKAGTYNRCLIEASIDPLVTIGPDGRITDVNESTEEVTGLSRNELIGTDFINYFTEPEKAREGYLLVFRDGYVRDYELEIRHRSGKITPVLYNATVYRDADGKVIGVFAAARDVSESKRTEMELLRLNQVLNQRSENLTFANSELEAQKTELAAQSAELTQQNAELEMQKKQLNEANKLKTNFLSNMSHELRTPLNSVIALSGVLNRRLAKKIPAEEYSYLEVIERNGKHLLTLINDILDISRIEAGREEMEIAEFNVVDVVSDVVEMIEPQAEQKEIELILIPTEENILLTSDAKKCRHIFQNLIGNAVKFTDKGKVEVQVSQNETEVRIRVLDTGIGIDKKHLNHIFDEFRQADGSTSRRFGGTGLGLSIAKKYASLLGGDISVISKPDEGSTFTLTLPKRYQQSTPSEDAGLFFDQHKKPIQPDMLVSGGGKTILLVEDSEPAVIQIKDFLEDSGYRILVASSGAEALEIISETIPDAMILDLMMPEVDGFEVLKKLRHAEPTEHVPVLILTAKHITKDDLKFLKRNNIHQLIQKGDVNRTELLQAVAGMVTPASTVVEEKKERIFQPIVGKPKVLIVEDNSDNMTTVKAVLGENYDIIEAVDGQQGIELAMHHHPHLILMDIALPGMDGVEAFKAIRAQAKLTHIPIVALTASAMTTDRETVLAHGFDAYLAKPINEKLFFNTINQVLYGK